jgi:signal transduction histidine kinase
MLRSGARDRAARASGALVAVAVAAAELANLAFEPAHERTVLAVALLVASAAPLVAWQRVPLVVSLASGAATVAMAALSVPHLGLGVLAAVFGVAHWGERRSRRVALVLLAVGVPVVPLLTHDAASIPKDAALYAGAFILGLLLRERRLAAAELAARARELERQRDRNARLAAAGERARIARELHDVLTHSVSVMVVQAQAGQAAADDTAAMTRALGRIEAVGRESLGELRRLLGSLRADGAAPELEPQPGLDRLDELASAVRDAGIAVSVARDGVVAPVPAAVDLSAYRIVQEALTNTLRHADAQEAEVRLRYEPGALRVEVRDDGRARTAARADGGGLAGMRERARSCGGTLHAGARAGGGFEVVAELPLGRRR